MASWEPLRNSIKNKLESVSSIQEVLEFPSQEFGGYPAAVLETVSNESEFETSNENKRTYIFRVYLLQDLESQEMKEARRIIQGVVDDVLDVFDQDQTLSGTSMPSNEVLVISLPALSSIYTGSFSGNSATYVVGEVELKVVTSISIT